MRAQTTDHWIENTPTRGWLSGLRLRDTWAYRELGLFFAWRDLKLRYKQTLLGGLWAVLQPLLAMALLGGLLEHAVHIASQGVPYAVFLYVGLAAWTALTTGVSRAAESLVEDPSLVTSVYFPRVLAPLGTVGPMVVDLALALVVGAPLMAAYGVAPPVWVVLLPICFLALMLVAVVVGIWLSALLVLYRDVRYALTFVLQLWLFATPVLYPSSLLHGIARTLLFLNPAAGAVELLRACVLGTPLYVLGLGLSLATTLLLGITGLAYFGRVSRRFADRI